MLLINGQLVHTDSILKFQKTFKKYLTVNSFKRNMQLYSRKVRNSKYAFIDIPFACSSSKEKQLPTDSGRYFNLLLDTLSNDNCINKQNELDPETI